MDRLEGAKALLIDSLSFGRPLALYRHDGLRAILLVPTGLLDRTVAKNLMRNQSPADIRTDPPIHNGRVRFLRTALLKALDEYPDGNPLVNEIFEKINNLK